MRVSKDPADYQYAPPPERTRRARRIARLCLSTASIAGGVLVLLGALDVI